MFIYFNIHAQDTIYSSGGTNFKNNFEYIDDYVLLNGIYDNCQILKSSLYGKLYFFCVNKTNYIHEEFSGLYGSYFHNDKYYVTTGNFNQGYLKIFNANDGKIIKEIINKNKIAFKSVYVSPYSKKIYTVDDVGDMQVFDEISGKRIKNYKIMKSKKGEGIKYYLPKNKFKPANSTWSINLNLKEDTVYIGLGDGFLIYSLKNKKIINRIHGLNEVTQFSFSPNRRFIAIPKDSLIYIYDNVGSLLKKIDIPYSIQAVTFTSNERIIFSKNGENIFYIDFLESNDIKIIYNKFNINDWWGDMNDDVLFIVDEKRFSHIIITTRLGLFNFFKYEK